MARKSKWMHLFAGVAVGVTMGIFLKLCLRPATRTAGDTCPTGITNYIAPEPLKLIGLRDNETVQNSNRTLVFVGVMTAEQYLESRARAVMDTWAQDLPGRIAFFSSEVSRAADLPLVPLRGVDDSYPPQKKSFLMLLYMYEKYGDRFEWFMRADDDVYVRGDKLGEFLHSVDSTKPQFIGQAGRGTNAERDVLALDYNENFCMGGPGVLISRETLKRVAPHVKYCLKHLYTTHEDVELGRCVAKFAGVSCTWSFDMQVILHHNSSGEAAYTDYLKSREVHRAITLHPVKDHRQMYRLHSYFKNFRIQALKERSLDLHREIAVCMDQLEVEKEQVQYFTLPNGEPLFPAKKGDPEYLGDNTVLGAPISHKRYKADRVEDIIPFDFISKSIYSLAHSNPKRRIEAPLKEALDDVIREVMEIINAPSRQRGRVIDFNELLYGYIRLDPIHGVDLILDLLLKYRRYRGRKMTAAVRRHAYLQQSFTAFEFRELPLGEPPVSEDSDLIENKEKKSGEKDYEDFDESSQVQNSFIGKLDVKGALETGLKKIQDTLPNMLIWNGDDGKEYSIQDRIIHFVLPLSGRQETFARFMKNYEDIVLKTDEAATLIIVLHLDGKTPQDYKNSETLVQYYIDLYGKDIKLIKMGSRGFSRGYALTEGLKECSGDDLVFFIDVDMMFNFITLRRIRLNTVKYYQLYFPIVFSEYRPDTIVGEDFNKFTDEEKVVDKNLGYYVGNNEDNEKSEKELTNFKYTKVIHDDFGYFRQYGFGILSIYKCDFERVGGFNLDIKGWGLEDVQLFETFIKSNLSVYRIADDSLVHKFHSVDCDINLEKSQYMMCLGTKASTYGSEKQMNYYMFNHPEILWPDEENEVKKNGTK